MQTDALLVFLATFLTAGVAGVAAMLRKGGKITWLGAASALLNSGLLGLGISLVWYSSYEENLYFLVGICVLAGLGGMTTVEFVLSTLRSGGFSFRLNKDGGVEFPKKKKDS